MPESSNHTRVKTRRHEVGEGMWDLAIKLGLLPQSGSSRVKEPRRRRVGALNQRLVFPILQLERVLQHTSRNSIPSRKSCQIGGSGSAKSLNPLAQPPAGTPRAVRWARRTSSGVTVDSTMQPQVITFPTNASRRTYKFDMLTRNCSVDWPPQEGFGQRLRPAALNRSLAKAPSFAGRYLLNEYLTWYVPWPDLSNLIEEYAD
jgi:hypothetical protein